MVRSESRSLCVRLVTNPSSLQVIDFSQKKAHRIKFPCAFLASNYSQQPTPTPHYTDAPDQKHSPHSHFSYHSPPNHLSGE